MSNDNMDEGNQPQSSYDATDLPEGGLAELELEEIRKQLKEDRKESLRKYAEGKLSEEGFS